jgi:hypothetical protein
MFKKLVLIAVLLTALLVTASPALALSGNYYVDTAYTGTEVGTAAQPFKTLDKAVAAAQANPNGGFVFTKVNGVYQRYGFIETVNPPNTGNSISRTALFALLGLASLILLAAGWFMMRRSRTLPSRV